MNRVFADLHNSDRAGRVRLNCQGTTDDLRALRLELSDGLRIVITDSEFEADAIVVRSEEESIWVAKIKWDEVRRLTVSDG